MDRSSFLLLAAFIVGALLLAACIDIGYRLRERRDRRLASQARLDAALEAYELRRRTGRR